jgi:tripartite-type tricarboxylate transporter receptor subunit TctC
MGPFVLITHPASPIKSMKELIAAARADPKRFNYASAGNGAPNHLATELLKNMAAINLTHVPYKGAPQGVADVLGGHIDLAFSSIAPILQNMKAGRLRGLAVSSARRSAQLPDIPTISESGVPGYEFTSWFGLVAPSKTPKQIIARLNDALVKVVHTAQIRSQFEALGADAVGSPPDDFAAFIRREWETNAKVVKVAGLKMD